MKRTISFLMLLLTANLIFSQESNLDKVSKELCEYFDDNLKDLKKISKQDRLSKFGLKLLSLYNKYEKDFKEEGIEVDISNQDSVRQFGEKVGRKLAAICPGSLLIIMQDVIEEESTDLEKETPLSFMEGQLKKIIGDDIYTIELKDKEGKTQKFIWLSNFEGSDRLISLGKKIKNVSVRLYYENFELFSPKLKEYIVRKKITKLEFLD